MGIGKADSDQSFTADPVGSPSTECAEVEKKPTAGSATSANRIDIEFDPANSKKVKKCEKIVFIQTVQKLVDGKPIMPGSFNSDWAYKDADALTDGKNKGLRVDYLEGETTPYYNDPDGSGTDQGYGDVGKKNGGAAKATMYDAPDTAGGDKGFYDKDANPGGYKKVVTKFETFAFCAKGPDCGKWYEGLTWEHKKTAADAGSGTSKITGHKKSPSKAFLKAFKSWNEKYGFTPCS